MTSTVASTQHEGDRAMATAVARREDLAATDRKDPTSSSWTIWVGRGAMELAYVQWNPFGALDGKVPEFVHRGNLPACSNFQSQELAGLLPFILFCMLR